MQIVRAEKPFSKLDTRLKKSGERKKKNKRGDQCQQQQQPTVISNRKVSVCYRKHYSHQSPSFSLEGDCVFLSQQHTKSSNFPKWPSNVLKAVSNSPSWKKKLKEKRKDNDKMARGKDPCCLLIRFVCERCRPLLFIYNTRKKKAFLFNGTSRRTGETSNNKREKNDSTLKSTLRERERKYV